MADDFRFGISGSIQGVDLNQLLVEHPASTYFMRVAADEPSCGVILGDVVVVDRSLKPRKNDVVIRVEASERDLKISRWEPGEEIELWGVVRFIIKQARV